jgi:hypothetical protein
LEVGFDVTNGLLVLVRIHGQRKSERRRRRRRR